MNFKIITNLFLSISPSFCDLIGQNRLGNNLMLMKFNGKQPQFRTQSFMISVLNEMTKTTAGRKAVKKFMTEIPNRRKKTRGWVQAF